MSSLPVCGQKTPCVQFLRDIPPIASEVHTILGARELGARDVAKLIAEYTVSNQNPFGTAEWKKGGIDAGPEIPLTSGFVEWWNGPDPKDVFEKVPHPRSVSETRFAPILAPRFFTHIQSNTLYPRSIQSLSKLGIQFNGRLADSLQNTHQRAASACWLVMRKEGLFKNQINPDPIQAFKEFNAVTKAGYETLPSVIDLATIALASKIADENSCFKDVEEPWIFSECEEVVSSSIPAAAITIKEHVTMKHFSHSSNVDIVGSLTNDNVYGLSLVAIRRF